MVNVEKDKKHKNNKKLYTNLLGVFLITTGMVLFIAFTSYFLNWKEDQSTLDQMTNKNILANNALGKLGNLLGNIFISGGIGIMAYFFSFLFTLLGLRVLTKRKLIPFGSFLSRGLFLCLWVPVFLYFIIPQVPIISGAYGVETNIFLESYIGKFGIGVLLFISLLTFILSSFKLDLGSFFEKKKKPEVFDSQDSYTHKTEEELLETVSNHDLSSTEEDHLAQHQDVQEIEIEESTPITPPSTEDLNKENLLYAPATAIESLDLMIEKPKEENTLKQEDIAIEQKKIDEYNPFLDLPQYQYPPLSLLKEYENSNNQTIDQAELEENKNKIIETLGNYGINIAQIKATIGPTVTLYEIIPEAGVRISKIKNLEDDIALSLSALGIRIIAPIPGKGTIGIEVPNKKPSMVSMRSVIASQKFQKSDMELPIAIGKTISNETFVTDLAKMPHLLMAGATGQGKSVGLNAIIASLLYKKHPSELKFVFVDPKKVELTLYSKIERHFLAKLPDTEEAIITDNSKVINTLNSLCIEMDDRYELLKNAYVRNIIEYNQKFKERKLNPEKGHKYLPYIVLVIDEFADLIMTAGKEVELPIARLAQLARAVGIHLIIATQRPSVNVITGMIKANFPARIAFRVTSKIDSRTILDASGADQLIGKGDMLFTTGNHMIRLQCAFVDTPEVDNITEYIGDQRGYPDAFLLPEYVSEESGLLDLDPSERDSMFNEAARVVVMSQQGSASLLQRKLKLGYNRAGRIIDQLESAGIVGPFEGSKARQVLIQDEGSLEQLLNNSNPNI